MLRLGHFLNQWKIAEIIVLGKLDEFTSCRPIGFSPITSKVIGKKSY